MFIELRVKTLYFLMVADFCDCASPWISGDTCERCQKKISETRLAIITAEDKPKENEESYSDLVPSSEKIIFTVNCGIKGRNKSDTNFQGAVILTKQNLYIVKRKFKVFGKPDPLTKESIPLKQITGLDQTFEKYLTVKSYHVQISRANNVDVIYGLTQALASQLINEVNAQLNAQSEQVSNSGGNVIDPIEQLTKMAALLEKGFITQEEFDKKKKELLN
jgi:hypothetical protein